MLLDTVEAPKMKERMTPDEKSLRHPHSTWMAAVDAGGLAPRATCSAPVATQVRDEAR
ncbi:MAG: hypothetical protein QM770_06855 [Tepidisphaeraceae bacterium]